MPGADAARAGLVSLAMVVALSGCGDAQPGGRSFGNLDEVAEFVHEITLCTDPGRDVPRDPWPEAMSAAAVCTRIGGGAVSYAHIKDNKRYQELVVDDRSTDPRGGLYSAKDVLIGNGIMVWDENDHHQERFVAAGLRYLVCGDELRRFDGTKEEAAVNDCALLRELPVRWR